MKKSVAVFNVMDNSIHNNVCLPKEAQIKCSTFLILHIFIKKKNITLFDQ